jgi:ankyrin repeat protein
VTLISIHHNHSHSDQTHSPDIGEKSPTTSEEKKNKIKDCIIEVVNQKAKLNFSDKDGLFTLDLAARYGLVDLVELLVKSGGDVNHKSHNNFTPLHWAASQVMRKKLINE